jgi:hypothetical protein
MEFQTEKFRIIIKPKVLTINMCADSSCKVSIILNKRNVKKEIEEKPDLIKKQAIFNGKIEASTNLCFDKKSQIFLEKIINLDVILIFPNEVKLAGKIRIDLAFYANLCKNSKINQ